MKNIYLVMAIAILSLQGCVLVVGSDYTRINAKTDFESDVVQDNDEIPENGILTKKRK